MSYVPLSLDCSNRQIVVVGGGAIALRRISYFVGFELEVTCIAPSIHRDIASMPVDCRCEPYERSLLGEPFIVCACTDNELLNRQIVADARHLGALANNCSDRGDCDFHFPAMLEHESCVVAVSSSGKNLHGAIALRNRIKELLHD